VLRIGSISTVSKFVSDCVRHDDWLDKIIIGLPRPAPPRPAALVWLGETRGLAYDERLSFLSELGVIAPEAPGTPSYNVCVPEAPGSSQGLAPNTVCPLVSHLLSCSC
jgi:hypothetical protein